jgi:hypothetical protein
VTGPLTSIVVVVSLAAELSGAPVVVVIGALGWMGTRFVSASVSLASQMSPAATSAPTITRLLNSRTIRCVHVRRGCMGSRGTARHASSAGRSVFCAA